MQVKRRDVLRLAAAAGAAWLTAPFMRAFEPAQRILDTHIHLFDPRRPGGIPWPLPTDSIYAPALPDRYAKLAVPLGVRGAIAIEASPRIEDNDWVLQVAAAHPIIVGFIGNLIPATPDYDRQLERLHANPLFLGIRCGNLWNRDLAADSPNPGYLGSLRLLAKQGLTLDTANPDPALIAAILHISQAIPALRIVIDHLPSLQLPSDSATRLESLANMRRLAANSNIFVKLSEIPVKIGDRVPLNLAYYKDHLDQIWDTFGEDRILFGSDWPNSDHLASYGDTFQLVRSYVATKGKSAQEKFFWSNSITAYRWHPRRADQAHA